MIKTNSFAPKVILGVLLLILAFPITSVKAHSPITIENAFYRDLFHEHGSVMLLIEPESGAILHANHAASDFYGYSLEELESMTIQQINILSPEEVAEERKAAVREDRNYFVFRHRLADGEIRTVEVNSYPLSYNDQQVLFSMITDITNRMALEQELRERQRSTLILTVMVASLLLISTLTLLRLNSRRKKDVRKLLDKERFQKVISDTSAELIQATPDKTDEIIHESIKKCGELIQADRSCLVKFSDDQKERIFEYEWCSNNVTSLKEQTGSMPLNRLPWVYKQSLENKMVLVDNVSKLPPEAVDDKQLLSEQQVKALLMMPITVNQRVIGSWGFESVAENRHWDETPLEMLQLMTKVFENAYERQCADQKLRDSEERFRLLVETAPDGIFLYANRKLAYANQAAARLVQADKPDDMIGVPIMHWLHQDYRSQVEERYRLLLEEKQSVPNMEQVYELPSGKNIDVEVSAAPIRYAGKDGALVYVRDISERKATEREQMERLQQERQHQKLESIGTLASGVAHEINNPVTGIMNYAQLILDDADPTSDFAAFGQEIFTESQRISDIVRDLLYFSRNEKQGHSKADIGDIIDRTISLLKALLRKDHIEILVNLPEDLPLLKCRSQQLQQVLMNLITNARDALNEKYPGYHKDKEIVISGRQYEENGHQWIRLTVEDKGMGIPESVQEQIFDPFFTTKPKELGTGLGMPISYGIVKEHHGKLSFETQVGEFTHFHMDLPVDNEWNQEV